MVTTRIDTRLQIETPENVTLTFELAGPGSRMAAWVADVVVRYGILWVASLALGTVGDLFGAATSTGLILLLLFLLEWWYGSLFEGLWNGRTPGKMMFGLRVVKEAGYPISFQDAVLRNLLRAADFLPFGYGVGLVCLLLTPRMQRIGDLVAGTIVVRVERQRYVRNTSAFENVEPLQPIECSGVFHVPERTLDVIEQLLFRRGELSKRRVEEIASMLSLPLARRLGFDLDRDRSIDRHVYFLRRVLRTFSGPANGPDRIQPFLFEPAEVRAEGRPG